MIDNCVTREKSNIQQKTSLKTRCYSISAQAVLVLVELDEGAVSEGNPDVLSAKIPTTRKADKIVKVKQ